MKPIQFLTELSKSYDYLIICPTFFFKKGRILKEKLRTAKMNQKTCLIYKE